MNDLTVNQGGAVATQDDFDPYAEYGRQNMQQHRRQADRFPRAIISSATMKVKVNTQMVANIRTF